MSGWSGGYIEWKAGNVVNISAVFSWQIQDAFKRTVHHRQKGRIVRVGGPAITMNPQPFVGLADLGQDEEVLIRHNPEATITSRGCIRKCGFCIVPEIEGDLVELTQWKPNPIVCDNNLLACSRGHYNRVIDSLKGFTGIDFNQGLDARLLQHHHAERLTELDLRKIRLAWDHVDDESTIFRAINLLRKLGIPKKKLAVYVLIGYDDTPDDALYRLQTLHFAGVQPNPMRYQPPLTEKRDSYVEFGWTDRELHRFMRYWHNLRWFGGIPFEEFTG